MAGSTPAPLVGVLEALAEVVEALGAVGVDDLHGAVTISATVTGPGSVGMD